MQENLWAHTLGPLNVTTQPVAFFGGVSETNSDPETSITASDWIHMSKGHNVCGQSSLTFDFASSLHT